MGEQVKTSRATLSLLAVLLLSTAACTPAADPVTRLSTSQQGTCAFTPDTCADLHRTRASAW